MHRVPDIPIWDMKVPTVLYDLQVGKKCDVNPIDFQAHFHVIQDSYKDHQFLFTDGSKDGHRVGCAVVSGGRFHRERLPDSASVYTAELRAIHLAIQYALQSRRDKFVVCVDSMSCLQAIENRTIDHPIVLDILENYYSLRDRNKDLLFCWVPSHVGIRGNEFADDNARSALDGRPENMALPFSDYRPIVKEHVRLQWANFWSQQVDNKLYAVQPTLGCWRHSGREKRREELILSRIRIGHTYLTHRYLLVGEDPPECISCQARLTVRHILVHCAEYTHIRDRYFDVQTLQELLDNIDPNIIMNFVREAGLFFLL